MKRSMSVLAFSLALSLGFTTLPALGHSDEYLDTVPGAHGGQLRMGGAFHFELVLAADAKAEQATPIKVYLTDHNNNVASNEGMKATLLIKGAGKPTLVKLALDGKNALTGSGAFTARPDLQATLVVTFADNTSAQMNFQPFKAKAAAKEHSHDEHQHGDQHDGHKHDEHKHDEHKHDEHKHHED